MVERLLIRPVRHEYTVGLVGRHIHLRKFLAVYSHTAYNCNFNEDKQPETYQPMKPPHAKAQLLLLLLLL